MYFVLKHSPYYLVRHTNVQHPPLAAHDVHVVNSVATIHADILPHREAKIHALVR
jgi:hypothetical protein